MVRDVVRLHVMAVKDMAVGAQLFVMLAGQRRNAVLVVMGDVVVVLDVSVVLDVMGHAVLLSYCGGKGRRAHATRPSVVRVFDVFG
jgi:hypothetical protein